jgi:hypothetical protein
MFKNGNCKLMRDIYKVLIRKTPYCTAGINKSIKIRGGGRGIGLSQSGKKNTKRTKRKKGNGKLKL